ncbi:hypothetical protein ACFVH9_19440 [Streptomyces hirsutus]|uniref:hypothetical protein n=1 Tax=Streptomyces hirsutus TaxID=35620 RepID=UPI003624D356
MKIILSPSSFSGAVAPSVVALSAHRREHCHRACHIAIRDRFRIAEAGGNTVVAKARTGPGGPR